MSKKKKFSISDSLSQGFQDTISIVENNEGIYRSATIPLSRLEPDPNNPRRLDLSLNEIQSENIKKDDPKFKDKVAQFEKIKELSESIKKSGLIHPIVVYKHTDKYRIVAGERRYLATVMAEKTEIEARVFHSKPSDFELKLVQWYENTSRENLSLFDRLQNISSLFNLYKEHMPEVKITGAKLQELTGMSKSHSTLYCSVINGPKDVIHAIQSNKIQSLDKAALLSSCKDAPTRLNAIDEVAKGINLQQLKAILNASTKAKSKNTHKETRGKKPSRINLGHTKNSTVVKTIINAVVSLPEFSKHQEEFEDIDWGDYANAKNAFDKLLKLIEPTV